MNKIELQTLIEKLALNIKMLSDHEDSYPRGKKRGNAYFTNKVFIEKRITSIKNQLKSIGRTTPVIKVYYSRGEGYYHAYFSDVSSEVAYLLAQNLFGDIDNITTAPLKLGTEIPQI